MRRPRSPPRHRRRARAKARARAIKLSGGMLAVTLVPAAAAQARTIQVTNLNDSASGTGTLRDAITTADSDNTTPSTLDTITFASSLSGSINLQTPLPAITDSIDIQGPGARVITLDASQIPSGSGPVISIAQYVSPALTISGLAMNNAPGAVFPMYGGGFLYSSGYASPSGSSPVVTLTSDSFSNDDTGYSGGAVDLHAGSLIVTGSTFSHDHASQVGGAIYTSGALTMSDSTIYDSSARQAGGLELAGPATITGSTIDDNATNYGGGGIYSFNNLTLEDTIVAGNSARNPDTADIADRYPANFSASFSVIQSVPSNLSPLGPSNVGGVSPALGLLANNGGPTDTQLPTSTSPVIDQGKAFGLIADQRGLARPVSYPGKTAPTGGDHTDIGATELQATLQQSPAVTGVSPSSGVAGDSVQITGSGFTGATAVKFAGTSATSFTVVDDGHITATVPAGSGTEDVRVTTPNGQSAIASSDHFSYLPAVTGVSPASGVAGDSVQVTGSGFTGATAVKFAGTSAASFTVVDDGHITATVPAGSGTENVRVTTANGQSAVASGDQFAYLPAVTGVSPASGVAGDSVQVTGSGFTGATVVKFAGTSAASFTVVDDGHITATVPAGSGVENVRVTTADGQSAVVTGDQFTYSQTTTTSTSTTPTTSTTSTTTTPTTSTTSTTTTPMTPTPPVQPRITGVSASATTIVWCQGAGCRYPATRLQFSLNRATTVRLVLRTRAHGHYKQIATTLLHGHRGINHDRIAGRWHGHLVPARPVQILVQIQQHHHWITTKTIQLTVRHTLRQV